MLNMPGLLTDEELRFLKGKITKEDIYERITQLLCAAIEKQRAKDLKWLLSDFSQNHFIGYTRDGEYTFAVSDKELDELRKLSKVEEIK